MTRRFVGVAGPPRSTESMAAGGAESSPAVSFSLNAINGAVEGDVVNRRPNGGCEFLEGEGVVGWKAVIGNTGGPFDPFRNQFWVILSDVKMK